MYTVGPKGANITINTTITNNIGMNNFLFRRT